MILAFLTSLVASVANLNSEGERNVRNRKRIVQDWERRIREWFGDVRRGGDRTLRVAEFAKAWRTWEEATEYPEGNAGENGEK